MFSVCLLAYFLPFFKLYNSVLSFLITTLSILYVYRAFWSASVVSILLVALVAPRVQANNSTERKYPKEVNSKLDFFPLSLLADVILTILYLYI